MGHLRIPADLLAARNVSQIPRNWDSRYLFTLNIWHAIQYVSFGRTVMEDLVVDYRDVLPKHASYGIAYALARGYGVEAITYRFADGEYTQTGAVVTLCTERFDMGYYAVQFRGGGE